MVKSTPPSSTPVASLTWTSSSATEGSDGIALGSLLAKTGYTTYDEGFVNTASTKSAITYIDGDAGILRYRGYPIEQLAEKSTFIEVSYLLIYGELPTKEQLDKFTTPDPAAHAAARGPRSGSSTASRATRTRCRCCPARSTH